MLKLIAFKALFNRTNQQNSITMNEKVYQILCRNIELCASSILASYSALNNPTEHNIDIALITSIIKLEEYSPDLSKGDSLNILLNAERLLEEIKVQNTEPSQL